MSNLRRYLRIPYCKSLREGVDIGDGMNGKPAIMSSWTDVVEVLGNSSLGNSRRNVHSIIFRDVNIHDTCLKNSHGLTGTFIRRRTRMLLQRTNKLGSHGLEASSQGLGQESPRGSLRRESNARLIVLATVPPNLEINVGIEFIVICNGQIPSSVVAICRSRCFACSRL